MVFGLFSKDRSLKRALEVATSVFRQSADRFAAMEKLKSDGSEASLFNLCKRFSVNADKTIEDHQEKEWVVEALVEKGAVALPAVRRYMRDAPGLHYPLSIVARIAEPPLVLEVVDELLAREEPGYTREPNRKMDIIEWLGEWQGASDEEVIRRIAPYLGDFDEGVRFKATDVVTQRPHAIASTGLARALVRPEEESKRLKLRIAEVMAANGFDLGEQSAAVTALIPGVLTGYRVENDRLVKA
jgi:hypothetical protein